MVIIIIVDTVVARVYNFFLIFFLSLYCIPICIKIVLPKMVGKKIIVDKQTLYVNLCRPTPKSFVILYAMFYLIIRRTSHITINIICTVFRLSSYIFSPINYIIILFITGTRRVHDGDVIVQLHCTYMRRDDILYILKIRSLCRTRRCLYIIIILCKNYFASGA